MARHRWDDISHDADYMSTAERCRHCDMVRVWKRDGVKADGYTPRYAWGYYTARGFVVPERVPSCEPRVGEDRR